MSLYLGNNCISAGGSSAFRNTNIGEIIQSTLPLTDVGLHLLDGSVIQRGSYADFVDYIAGLVSTYPDLFTTEANWQSAVTTYGVCGKFVYNSTNQTVRLPKYSNKIYTGGGAASVYGNGKTLGLTDGTQNYGATMFGNYRQLSSITQLYNKNVGSGYSGQTFPTSDIGLGVVTSGESGLYADLSTITTALDGYWYIVIATSTKTQIEVDIDEIATDLNGKADVDLTNVTDTGYIKMAGASMPSNTKVVVTVGASGAIYQAPADGWFEFMTTSTATQAHYTYLINETTTVGTYAMGNAGVVSRGYVPAKKNDLVSLGYFNSSIQSFYFVYAKGSESEA